MNSGDKIIADNHTASKSIYYGMDRRPRGFCLIFNHKEFDKTDDPSGNLEVSTAFHITGILSFYICYI